MKPLDFLKQNNIEYTIMEHPALFTCEDEGRLGIEVPGIKCKNLFLRDKKKNNWILAVVSTQDRVDLKELGKILPFGRLSFAKPEDLLLKLGVTPGSVSPLCLLNNKEKDVQLYLDKGVFEAREISMHPNVNTASVTFSHEMFEKYLQTIDWEYEVLEIPKTK